MLLEPKKWHCATCIMQYGSSPRLQAKSERKRRGKGCFDYKTKSYRLGNFRYNSCIGNFTTEVDYLIEAFTMYEKGHLPFEGNLSEQPAKIMDIFDIIHKRRSEFQKKEASKNQGK